MSVGNARRKQIPKDGSSQQYERRNCVELTGIPEDVPVYQVGKEVIKIYQAGDFKVHGKSLDHLVFRLP